MTVLIVFRRRTETQRPDRTRRIGFDELVQGSLVQTLAESGPPQRACDARTVAGRGRSVRGRPPSQAGLGGRVGFRAIFRRPRLLLLQTQTLRAVSVIAIVAELCEAAARTFSFFSPLAFLPLSSLADAFVEVDAPACLVDFFAGTAADFFLAFRHCSLRRFASACNPAKLNPGGLSAAILARSSS